MVEPKIVKGMSKMVGGNLKIGLLFATIFPILLEVGSFVLNLSKKPSMLK